MRLFLLLVVLLPQFALAKEIALSFDDAPRGVTPLLAAGEREKLLMKALQKHSIQAIFFVNTAQFEKLGPEGRIRIENYAKAGHLLGNHTHSHPDINKIPLPDEIADIRTADMILKTMNGYTHWFRFPYLREGADIEKQSTVRAELSSLGLRNGYVTINTYDWAIDGQVQQALSEGHVVDRIRLGKVYVGTILDDVHYYEHMGNDILGRSPRHILLLHENDVATLYVDDLVSALKDEGWTIINPVTAYEDEIASYNSIGLYENNPGRIGEIARDQQLWPNRWCSPTCNEEEIAKRLKAAVVFGSPSKCSLFGSNAT